MSTLFTISEVHISWRPFFSCHQELVEKCFASLDGEITPSRDRVLRVFTYPLDEIRVVIVGQDPYPGAGVADGLAFSAGADTKIPASLRNIFKEYVEDLNLPTPTSPDLSAWADQGVALLNRTLTTSPGERNAHLDTSWREFTYKVAEELAARDVVAILWGSFASELAPLFRYTITSVHPSPLSARRGFFGSKPFSNANKLLLEMGKSPIDWSL